MQELAAHQVLSLQWLDIIFDDPKHHSLTSKKRTAVNTYLPPFDEIHVL
jgi:hypothetical protein